MNSLDAYAKNTLYVTSMIGYRYEDARIRPKCQCSVRGSNGMYQECMMKPFDDAGMDEVCVLLITTSSTPDRHWKQFRDSLVKRLERLVFLLCFRSTRRGWECVSRRHGVALDL
jgi:hypothetical protein